MMMTEPDIRKLLSAQEKIVAAGCGRRHCVNCRGNEAVRNALLLVLGEHPDQERALENCYAEAAKC
jgi:hypothetical protein